jgi:hypothetical protein
MSANYLISRFLAFFSVLLLCQCSGHSDSNGTPIPKNSLISSPNAELSGPENEEVRRAYTMRELVCDLDGRCWEVDPTDRSAYLRKLYPDGIPEDFVRVPEDGAQPELFAIRLDKDLLAVVVHIDMIGPPDSLRVLRRISNAWKDVTPEFFPYTIPKGWRFRGERDKSVVAKDPGTGKKRRFVWTGRRFVEETP